VKSKRSTAQFLGIFDMTFRKHAAACNEHIAKIAALQSFDASAALSNLTRWKVLGSSNFGNMPNVRRRRFKSVVFSFRVRYFQ
jgi:hypothetical protein